LFWPARYSAEVRLRCATSASESSATGAGEQAAGRYRRAQAALIQSSAVLEEVLQRMEIAALPSIRKEHDPLTWLGQRLTVDEGALGDVLQIRVSDTSAEEADLLARALVDVYWRETTRRRLASLQQLKDERARAEESLRQKRQQREQCENGRLAAAEKELQQARIDLHLARAELTTCEQRRTRVDRVTVSDATLRAYLKEDEVGRQRLKELNQVENQIKQWIRVSALKERDSNLPAFYRQRDEARKKVEARQEEIRQLLAQQLRTRAMEEYQAQIGPLRERVGSFEKRVQSLEEEVRQLKDSPSAKQLQALCDEIPAGIESIQKLNAEIAIAAVANRDAPREEGSQAKVTVRQIEPGRRVRVAGLGGAASCVLLVLAVCWRESRLRRIMAGSDLSSGLGMPVVGSIPFERKAKLTSSEELDKTGRVREAVDALRTVLLRDVGHAPRLILVTSAVNGEGKTSLAVRLAASLARAWRRTLLIDADLRKPQAHALFGKPFEPGLSELLRGEAEPTEVVQQAGLSRLWLVPAGHWDAHAIQALAQDGAGRLFDALREQYDFLVLDAGPVLPVADTLLLSTHVDVVLLVVRSGLSRSPLVAAAQQRLGSLDAPLRGAVLLGPDADIGSKGT
jgi:capsular exopolysaccharide synthesis family protein